MLFWGVVICVLGIAFNLNNPVRASAKVFWFGSQYWFVISYIGLYILSPVLNSFIKTASEKQYLFVLSSFFAAEFIYGWIISSDSYDNGYSTISFIGLYLLARYLRIHSKKITKIKPITCALIYFLLTFIPAVISFIGIRNGWMQLHPLYYSSPFVIAASTFLLLSFSQLTFYNCTINWIARSTFSVYIISMNPIIVPYFKTEMVLLSESVSAISYSFIVILLSVVSFLICTVFDKLRISSWNLLCSACLDKLIYRFEKYAFSSKC